MDFLKQFTGGKSSKADDTLTYIIAGVVVVGAIFILPEIIKLIQIPGKILEIPGDILNTLRKAAADGGAQPYVGNAPTTIPGVSVATLQQYIDKPVYALTNTQAVRTSANSNAPTKGSFPRAGQMLGYFYSAVGEPLKSGVKVWAQLSDKPGGSITGYYPMTSISLKSTGIGCLN